MTFSLFLSVASCTCAIDAEAIGFGLNVENNMSIFCPKSLSIILTDSSPGKGLTSSCNLDSSLAIGSDNKSLRVEII